MAGARSLPAALTARRPPGAQPCTPAARAQMISQGEGAEGQGRKGVSQGPEAAGCTVAAERFAKKKSFWHEDAERVGTRTGFRNSNRTPSVFKDSCERLVCPKPTSKSLPVISMVRESPGPAD